MASYSGVGYPGGIDNLGNPVTGVFKIQDYLNFQGPLSTHDYFDELGSRESDRIRVDVLAGVSVPGDMTNFLDAAGYPKTLADFIVNYRVYVYAIAGGALIPGLVGTIQQKMDIARTWLEDPLNGHDDELVYTSSPTTPNTSIYATLVGFYVEDSLINAEDWNLFIDGTQVAYGSLNGADQLSVSGQLLETNYAEFINRFVPGSGNPLTEIETAFKNFVQRIVSVDSLSDPNIKLSYEKFFEAYFGTPPGLFDNWFAGFVQKVYGDPFNTPSPLAGTDGFFNPTVLFDQWTQEILKNYAQYVPGSGATAPSSVAAGAEKTRVLNRIFRLLVLMIESLQKVAAAQSDRLNLFSKWQKAYTDLQNNIKYFLKDGVGVRDIGDDARNNLNSFNASLTEIIKARKSVLGDDAKNLQTQINQSNDTVNQQTSIATSILQELATILSSLYR
jgi:hypothetical protein